MRAIKARYCSTSTPPHWRGYWLNDNMRWELVRNKSGLPIMYTTRKAAELAASLRLNYEDEAEA